MTSPDATAISIVLHPSFWLCSNGDTTLTIDRAGNISYIKTLGWHNQDLMEQLTGSESPPKSAADSSTEEAGLIEHTRQLATALLTREQVESLKPLVRHEVLLWAKLPDGRIHRAVGRTLIRLVGPQQWLWLWNGYVQAIFDPQGKLLRVDLQFPYDSWDKSLVHIAFPPSLRLPPRQTGAGDEPFTMGSFFSATEWRFECNAFLTEGEPFLDVESKANPFARDFFNVSDLYHTSFSEYRRSQDYRWWAWEAWQKYGRMGTFRGNWIVRDGSAAWENSNQVILHHALSSYPIAEGIPTATHVVYGIDNRPLNGSKQYPWAMGLNYTSRFFDDLEKCDVAFFFTHGGPDEHSGMLDLLQQFDLWVNFMPQTESLGEGKLRHVFLESCDGATYFNPKRDLTYTWIRHPRVDGLRTVCAIDGLVTTIFATGYEFFGRYNKGESISDAWALGQLDENPAQFPVTIAYGESLAEAADTLLHGRFAHDSAGSKIALISIWRDSSAH